MNERHRHKYIAAIRSARHNADVARGRLNDAMEYGIDHNADSTELFILKNLIMGFDQVCDVIDVKFPSESLWGGQ